MGSSCKIFPGRRGLLDRKGKVGAKALPTFNNPPTLSDLGIARRIRSRQMINKVILIGRLETDPEIRSTSGGTEAALLPPGHHRGLDQ